MGSLLETIQGFMKATHHILPLSLKIKRKGHKDFFLENTMKKNIVDVKLMKRPVADGSKSQQAANNYYLVV